MTKIDIVSGFLGAGKTTLIKKMLSEAYQGEKLVLIENEFGEISIDGGFLKDSGVQISEMSSGCICCSLVGDFNKALHQVHEQFAPDRILIEPSSGVGKLSDVIVAVENTVRDEPDMKLNSFVTVADATKVKVYMKNFGEFYNNQIEAAGTIILSRTQKLSQEKLEAAVALLREKNPTAAILTTPWDQLDGKTLLSAVEKVSLADELLARMQAEHEAEEASTTITTTTMMSMMTMMSMSITIIMTTTRTRATAAAAITTMMMTMTMTTNMSITITRAAATMTTRNMTTIMTTTSMSITITMTASATTRSAPATTITTTPTRCSPAGAPRRSTPTRRRTSAAS